MNDRLSQQSALQPLSLESSTFDSTRLTSEMSQSFEAFIIPSPSPFNSSCTIDSPQVKVDVKEINISQGKDDTCTMNGTKSGVNNNNIASWMERMEGLNGGLPGAYDVIRCDITCDPLQQQKNRETKHLIWGLDFHLSRLQNSFQELLPLIHAKSKNHEMNDMIVAKHILDKAMIESKAIINALVMKECRIHEEALKENQNSHSTIIVKLTIFWAASTIYDINDAIGICVRGHASCDGKIINPLARPKSIITSLALPSPLHINESHTDGMSEKVLQNTLPDRMSMPHAKISSWSKQRKLVQDKDTFQPIAVHEVLLLDLDCCSTFGQCNVTHLGNDRSCGDVRNYAILEGVSSNFFAVYQDNTIRTASSKVLFGYVRHLVLQYAPKCGLTIDPRPCRLEDGMNGLWKETFITSSSRLIYPIKQILIPDYEDKVKTKDMDTPFRWKEFWTYEEEECSNASNNQNNTSRAVWESLLHEILAQGGYKQV